MQEAARRIVRGDTSIAAANALESALLLDRRDDEEGLLEVLALYAPKAGRPYADEKELRAAIVSVLGVEGQRG
ncbi:hypothetical protein [Microlunatus sagamiharensis]|uniref:hypothetical protein n=1 Tax=Microlunatus sagamiharensis TaxID=546874 RepID=UPI0012FE5542|nr:hypothetical protein [Microlunatus sagamiharensis]